VSLYELHEHPELDSPVLLQALDGWIDAGIGAATAIGSILGSVDSTTIATFDADALLDHRARRPTMHLVDGVNTGLTWPTIELRVASDRVGNDLLLLVGAEPDHLWRAFSTSVVDLVLDFGARMVVGLGAYPAAVPHTRPTMLSATATSADLASQVGFVRGTIDVPAGVQAAVEIRCAEVGLPALGLWAQVPHYAAGMPFPAASAALINGVGQAAGVSFDAAALDREARATGGRLDELIGQNPEHQQMVAQLEQAVDTADEHGGDLPTGDQLAEELQKFLREQGPDTPPDP
jgi:proteasome assembly chaperone (PAC2) family protein